MTRRAISVLILVLFTAVITLWVFPKKGGYTERSVKVLSFEDEIGEFSLRFYNVTPDIPYMGMNEYAQFIGRQPFNVQQSEDGTYVLENWNGAKLICDSEKGQIFVQDWNAFMALPMPLEKRTMGLKDVSLDFVRIVDVTYEGEATPVTFDFAKYGIRFYSDEHDIYFPVSTLSNMMTDIATNYMVYDGENLHIQRIVENGVIFDSAYISDVILAQICGEDRPEDIIRQCYADICFNFDYFYGHPGTAVLDKALDDKGLDMALESLGEEGKSIKEGLLSSSLEIYLGNLTKLFFTYLGDGHTVFSGESGIATILDRGINDAFVKRAGSSYKEAFLNNPIHSQQMKNEMINVQRALCWGEDNYREYGRTAIIRLDSFLPDEAAWDSYYNNDGEFPDDSLGTVITGLEKASQNPKIDNVIFDLSCNNGGSPDPMMMILGMTTGQDKLYGWNNITRQPMAVTFEIDANFDGVYDKKDKEVKYDFNYGVLVTRHAFSCGNLFPIIIQEEGAVLIGEPSSGGGCSVQIGSDIEGLYYLMSSGQWKLMDYEGNSVEGGCSIDVPIKTGTMQITELAGDPYADMISALFGKELIIPAYQEYFEDKDLDEIMNEWFSEELDKAS
ncbi:S41 family peptidase [Butyrivibrio sp. LC3010]|uniref:S41 family peptidase n=1 Tax=Butyrivibrio sp. LC3010 TaxID=1280680 RepID=UPI0004793B1D|nr:S41 family peptidase [Butyrivibrio sp. LC3010]